MIFDGANVQTHTIMFDVCLIDQMHPEFFGGFIFGLVEDYLADGCQWAKAAMLNMATGERVEIGRYPEVTE